MLKNKTKYFILSIFVLTFLIRLFFALKYPVFSGDESYFHLRIINHITQTGMPLIQDTLSHGGSTLLYPQLFHYLLIPFSLVPILLKILPALLSATIVPITYLISKQLTKKKKIQITIAFLSAFIPIELQTNINTLSIFSLLLPLILLTFYTLMNIEKKRNLYYFIALSFILPLLHPISFIIVFALLFYIIISTTESIHITTLKKEAIYFSMILITLINFLIFRKALIQRGFSIILSKISPNIFQATHLEVNIIQYIYLIGIIPIILGIAGMYIGIFKKKNENMILLSSSVLGILTLMILNILNIQTGALLLSPFLVITSALSLEKLSAYLKITKFDKIKKHSITILIILLIIFSVIPSLIIATTSAKPSQEIYDLASLKKELNTNDTIMSIPEQGILITSITQCQNVVDNTPVLVSNIRERFEDSYYVYNTWSSSKALQTLKKYNAGYILISEKAKSKYKKDQLLYLEDEKCFKQERETIYKIRC